MRLKSWMERAVGAKKITTASKHCYAQLSPYSRGELQKYQVSVPPAGDEPLSLGLDLGFSLSDGMYRKYMYSVSATDRQAALGQQLRSFKRVPSLQTRTGAGRRSGAYFGMLAAAVCAQVIC